MRCPACWSCCAERCTACTWLRRAAGLLLLSKVRCRHCFHEFYAPLWRTRRLGLAANSAQRWWDEDSRPRRQAA